MNRREFLIASTLAAVAAPLALQPSARRAPQCALLGRHDQLTEFATMLRPGGESGVWVAEFRTHLSNRFFPNVQGVLISDGDAEPKCFPLVRDGQRGLLLRPGPRPADVFACFNAALEPGHLNRWHVFYRRT